MSTFNLIRNPLSNRGTAQSIEDRCNNKTYGIIPSAVETLEQQAARCLEQVRSKSTDLEKYIYLSNLRNSNVTLFYRLLMDNFEELVPIVYTPTVGEACVKFSHIYNPANCDGLYISIKDKGNVAKVLDNWPYPDPDITVVTDGSRILGLGDLGINGMGIPIGKLSLYIGAAGINPLRTLPITLDLGTNTPKHLEDPMYIGLRQNRPEDPEFFEFLDEVMDALSAKWPNLIIQHEDFSGVHAFALLDRQRSKYSMFNDDIQGTGAVILSGLINAFRESGVPLKDQKILFLGAGSAGVGVASQIRDHFVHAGNMSLEEATSHFWLVDTKGLITADRGDNLAEHKKKFMRLDNNGKQFKDLESTLEYVKPTCLIGLSTQGGVFTPKIISRMAELNKKPIIFPLSNPLKNSECTFEAAMQNSECRVLFASGTMFPAYTDPATQKTYYPGQGNNMYVFPGIGLGAILAQASSISDDVIYTSSVALANTLTDDEKASNLLYPRLCRIREVSTKIAAEVMKECVKEGVAKNQEVIDLVKEGDDAKLISYVQSKQYNPAY
ncbi:malate dehydrogenase [Neocallimastix californiae]|jgi:malate dehydrogenase (oxaloacetate-decarboxylating)(NADP+)|uniref:Malic enzyme n=1 Tax=Neocallimastix californiae TaxID=1754190 RepID=A0A1Y2BRZ2_9FUNG|nr:malate dehydrogenase [Neocallimastix californiae]|eukprot:ORY37522.1 malate dehydrogenase [Neocallimastix californiae]